MKASVKYKVIYRHRKMYSISEMCRFFGVSRSGYYGYVKRMEIPAKDLPLAEKIRECQAECRSTYGYRRVHIWLERHGIHHNPKFGAVHCEQPLLITWFLLFVRPFVF